MPFLSVIVPVYNAEKYLSECLESILNQHFQDYEIILVDDGSNDNSVKICDEYARRYSFISVIHQKNSGSVKARQTGIIKACGKYITFIDSDDYIESDAFEYMTQMAKKYDADAVICGLYIERQKDILRRLNDVASGLYTGTKLETEIYPKLLTGENCGVPGIISSLCNKIFKRELIEPILMNAEVSVKFGEDTLCIVPCIMKARKVYVSDKVFYHYRNVETSVTHSYDKTLKKQFIFVLNLLSEIFKNNKYDGKEQLCQYAVKFSMQIIQQELLFNREDSLIKRVAIIKQYCSETVIAEALANVSQRNFHGMESIKFRVLKNKQIMLLFFLCGMKHLVYEIFHKRKANYKIKPMKQ